MHQHKQPAEEWERDIAARQRNVVFPATVQNEARFWRNLGNQPWTPTTRIGIAILSLFVFGLLGRLVIALFQEGVALRAVLVVLAIWGPIFIATAWVTKRALRTISGSKRKR